MAGQRTGGRNRISMPFCSRPRNPCSGKRSLIATAFIWNVTTGRRVHVLRGHSGTVAAIAFSPNRRWVATAGPIAAGVWPVSTGRILFYLRGHEGLLTGVAFSPDGHTILTSSADGTVRTYNCEVCAGLNALVRLAEVRLARGG